MSADPFSDIEGIVSAEEKEIPVSQSTLLGGDTNVQYDAELFLEQFPQALKNKCSFDIHNQTELEQSIHNAMKECHCVRERLYLVRFAESTEKHEVKKLVENYINEINRLEAKVSRLKRLLYNIFFKSLLLDDLGIVGDIDSTFNSKFLSKNQTEMSGIFLYYCIIAFFFPFYLSFFPL